MPDCFDSEEILKAAIQQVSDGNSSMAEHAAECDLCRRKVIETAHALRSVLQPANPPSSRCLDDNEIAELVDGVAPVPLRAHAEVHFAECRDCRQNLRELFHIIADLPAATPLFEYIVRVAREKLDLLLHPENGFGVIPLQPIPALRPGLERRAVRWEQHLSEDHTLSTSLHAVGEDKVIAVLCQATEESVPWAFSLYLDDSLLHAEPLRPQEELELELELSRIYRLEVGIGSARFNLLLDLVKLT